MADVAFDAATGSANVGTYAHTCSGSNRLLFVLNRGGVGAPTYNGVALTLVQSLVLTGATGSTATPMELWGLVNPDSGTNNVVNGGGNSQSCAISFNNAQQSLVFDAIVTNESGAGATALTTNLTTLTDRSMIMCCEWGYFFGAPPLSGTNLTFRVFTSALGSPAAFSSPIITPVGTNGFQTQLSGNAGDKIAHILVAVTGPIASTPPIPFDVDPFRPPRARQVRSF